ncbi:hypothetical protein T03_3872 [Trichinella britovi]|uniref:Uncharacterized protein n=1 Tax=Trichinella britovi TaxID=45882 RepID=A0A0V1CC62_TRIBR|nr:hypothetical protein T03_3872 [Trichinella britovi]
MSRTATQLQRRHCSSPCVHSKLLLFFFLLLTTFTADLQQALLPATGMQKHRTACLTSGLPPSFILSHRNSTVSVSNGSPLNVDLIGFNPCASTVCFRRVWIVFLFQHLIRHRCPISTQRGCNTVGHLLPASASGQQSIYSQAWCGDRWAPAGRPTCLPACRPPVTSRRLSSRLEMSDVFLVHFPSFVALCWSAEKKSTTTTTSTTILSPLSNGQRP